MVHRDEYRQMLLAGTVSFPATFPQVGKLTLDVEHIPAGGESEVPFLSVAESPSARVTLVRRVMIKSVRAVFVPRDVRHVNYADGEWLLSDEILPTLQSLLDNHESLHGIVFVAENEPSILNVSAGMTAAESVQYYPPLPSDPAHNHYNAWPASTAARASSGASHSEILGTHACSPLICETHLGACSPKLDYCEGNWSCATTDDGVQLTMQSVPGKAQAQFHQIQSQAAQLVEETLWSCHAFSPGN